MVAHETPDLAAARLAAGAVRRGFVLQALHAYTDRAGCPSYWRIRAKHPRTGAKWIRPMKLDETGYVLGERPADEHPDGKLLYRLHELVARADELVIVTEGEHKADLLAALGLLTTTSGGADSAGKADWRPLAGRAVMVWPDHDEAGQRYAEAVIRALAPLECVVRVVEVTRLGLAAKGDAADWLSAHPGATADDVLTLTFNDIPDTGASTTRALSGPANPLPSIGSADAPNTCKYGGGKFELTERGVFFTGPDRDGNERAPIWMCSPLGVIAKTRDGKSGEWGRLLEWYDDDQVRHQWPMPLELLEGDGVDVRRELARLGLHIATSRAARDLLAAYIKVWPVDRRARCVDRLGWHGSV